MRHVDRAHHFPLLPLLLYRRAFSSAVVAKPAAQTCRLPQRSNIGNARVAGLERDLGIARTDYGGYGYNLLLTAFYIAYVIVRNVHL